MIVTVIYKRVREREMRERRERRERERSISAGLNARPITTYHA